MWIPNATPKVNLLLISFVIVNLKIVHTFPRKTIHYRIHSKGPPSLPPFLTNSPPRASAAQNFHSDYDIASFIMPSQTYHSPNFNSPSSNYGPPPSQEYGPPPSQDYAPPSSHIPSSQYGPPPSSHIPSSQYGPPSSQIPSSQYGPPSSQIPSSQYGPPASQIPSSQYGPPSSQIPSSQYGPPSRIPASQYGPPSVKPMIHKHIYVHVPPPEPDNQKIRAPLTTIAPQKHYRIVFIKAPTEAPVTMPTIPLQPPEEEKTLVYVLVTKPDEVPDLVLPKPASTTPSKPEVYFIRYKAQKDSNDGPYPPAANTYSSSSPTLGPPLAVFGAKNRYNSPK